MIVALDLNNIALPLAIRYQKGYCSKGHLHNDIIITILIIQIVFEDKEIE